MWYTYAYIILYIYIYINLYVYIHTRLYTCEFKNPKTSKKNSKSLTSSREKLFGNPTNLDFRTLTFWRTILFPSTPSETHKRKHHLPTIHFLVHLLLVSGRSSLWKYFAMCSLWYFYDSTQTPSQKDGPPQRNEKNQGQTKLFFGTISGRPGMTPHNSLALGRISPFRVFARLLSS